ncbi:substrate-binding periplasmic protein [Marinibactrum halimedae]|uniref:Amino acid ABC transporter n=1 Tax=Marinibactrum halimedae TaxID=1444977 RepID=A0AA37T7N2_9GAMM|nr:transporter substrate-binding domain-containing protein [Marinibactrum halimedae]MCD9457806.1 transporter substrate-binding domain-containing protein [Marinibactrum halimedae]GLS24820.1 amino acid ABC transporter [Marinibactrum halimedae]
MHADNCSIFKRSTFTFCLLLLLFLTPSTNAIPFFEESLDPLTLQYLVYDTTGAPIQISPASEDLPPGGIISEVIFAIFNGSDYTILPRTRPIARIKRDTYEEKLDNWITYGLRSWENDPDWGGQFLASTDILNYEYSLVYLKGKTAPASDLTGKVISVIQGYQYGALLGNLSNRGATILEVKSQVDAIEALQRGRADFYLGNLPRMQYLVNNQNINNVTLMGQSLNYATPLTIMMSKDTPETLRIFVNDRLRLLKEKNALDAIVSYYLGSYIK